MRFESYLKAFCKLNLKNTIVCNFLMLKLFFNLIYRKSNFKIRSIIESKKYYYLLGNSIKFCNLLLLYFLKFDLQKKQLEIIDCLCKAQNIIFQYTTLSSSLKHNNFVKSCTCPKESFSSFSTAKKSLSSRNSMIFDNILSRSSR